MEGPQFLKKKYNTHASPEVQGAAKRTYEKTGEKVPQNPESQIQNYLDRFKEITEREDPKEKERGLAALKKVLHKEHVIQEENIPESYFRLQQQIAREQGHGDIEITEEMRSEAVRVIKEDQKASMNQWIDYLSSNDALYPDWAKYWAFKSVLGMSAYDKEKHQFGKRSKQTTVPFPDLDREALSYVVDAIEKKIHKQEIENPVQEGENQYAQEKRLISDEEFQELLSTENFAKYYAFAIEHITADSSELYKITEGEWIKFEQGSDPKLLTESIQGHGTGWCTAGESTAAAQLKQGDFYVYFSKNNLGEVKIPRLAIRMEEDSIAEVRGVAPEQNIDPYIAPVLEEKMGEFGEEGEEYRKKSEDMKRLTEIDKKHNAGEELGKEDLHFLYELDKPIEGFGYKKDPRIKNLIDSRNNPNKDIAFALDCRPDQVSFTKDEALSGDIVFHYNHLSLDSIITAKNLVLPQSISGHLILRSIKTAKDLVFPKSVGGNLDTKSLKTAKNSSFPETVGGNLVLRSLTKAENITLPQTVGGDLDLSGLTTAENLTLPETVGGGIYLNSLVSTENLTLPESVGGGIFLNSLVSTENLILPQSVGGTVELGLLSIKLKNKLRDKYPALNIE